ncbi:hypothetical protein BDY19DRAFT_957683 [Irpex rosettiformis]|uniref:Uncharacterized protein n=1 Tax=Irpex rosettiformis TaxID=378272 RepID=A0ACB8TY04_9APHY|nr:hypothetical protein BDY19DRAFT_957683 [Irpex rosettiformis]
MDHSETPRSGSGKKACRLVASWMNICYVDFITIVCVVIFACYVIWGANYTIRLIKWLRKKVSGPRTKDPEANLERTGRHRMDPRAFFRRDRDVSHSPTLRLQRFMHRSGDVHGFVPPTDYLPNSPPSSPSAGSDSSDGRNSLHVQNDPVLQERLRMARFCFPSPPRSPTPPPADVEDFFSPLNASPRSSGCSNDTVGDHLSDLIFNPYWTQKHGQLAQGQSFGMLNFEDAMSPQAEERIPDTPPPTYDEAGSDSFLKDEKESQSDDATSNDSRK